MMSEQSIGPQDLDSPVKRLYQILEAAFACSEKMAAINVWRKVLHVEDSDPSSLYLALADLVWLFNEARKSVEQLQDVNREYYLETFPIIEEIISNPNLMQP